MVVPEYPVELPEKHMCMDRVEFALLCCVTHNQPCFSRIKYPLISNSIEGWIHTPVGTAGGYHAHLYISVKCDELS